MIKKPKSTKTKRVTNADLELDVVNPVITAGVIDPLQPTVLTDEELERLKLRKKLELELIKKFDKDTISRKECWFLMDSEWLNKWSAFVLSDGEDPEPGPMTTSGLHDSSDGKVLPNLRSRIDYRGVNPLVYYIFIQLYGKDKSPELPRYLVDIYGPVVDDGHLAKSQYIAQKEAMFQVNKIRPQWLKWEIDDKDDEEDNSCCWGYITREHIETFIYWGVRCCARKSSARQGIKYSEYKPLTGQDDSRNSDMDTTGPQQLSMNDDDDDERDTSTVNDADRGYDPGVWLRALIWR